MDIALRDGMKPNAYYVAAESFTGDLAYTRWTLRTEAERAAHNAIACGMKLATVFDSATHESLYRLAHPEYVATLDPHDLQHGDDYANAARQ
jgi:hypothetical protein